MLGGINGEYLADILLQAELVRDGYRVTEEVWAAVAYASGLHHSGMLLRWCFENEIPLKFWGRLDDTVPVAIEILDKFLSIRSPDYICKLVKHHHAKVIWWRGFGVYIGSANLTYSAWNKNVEAGCFIEEAEIDPEQEAALRDMFDRLDEHASPLTDELRNLMVERAKKLAHAEVDAKDFWSHTAVNDWQGVIVTSRKKSSERQRDSFLTEWNETLQVLRDIGHRVSAPEARPAWVDPSASPGAQADQFLHAHYYHCTFDGRRANYAQHFEKNKLRREAALQDALTWWKSLPSAPSDSPGEDVVINSTSKELANYLAPDRLINLTKDEFRLVAGKVHAMVDFARRARNRMVNLPDGRPYTIPEKLDALCETIWGQTTANGRNVLGVLSHILYEGGSDQLPQRLWEAIADPAWKIDGMGISAIGEMVGWAVPDRYPPRNGRTSKALRSLGYDVKVHVT
ncbi:phosphatidylserine/phosphatidylglycerophosphate/cardiolipin synthase family protein [Sphingobium fluviale]|uniref:Phosphatidylserine/phosphatidylglycerophosphate/ cardiolipin synthase family protein n=1 Tax=Sphingobium fluviale TaxID=2506423 RepID=A0A4Q1KG90_9SPHN|nr:phosphatidylserine/phosphatidylglycerophosphate/cardiolipin synthase family protein [Sphingobium fluviale]